MAEGGNLRVKDSRMRVMPGSTGQETVPRLQRKPLNLTDE